LAIRTSLRATGWDATWHPCRVAANGWNATRGVAVEQTALLIDGSGHATVVGNGTAYFLQAPGPARVAAKTPLTYLNIAVQRIDVSGAFDFGGGLQPAVSATQSRERGCPEFDPVQRFRHTEAAPRAWPRRDRSAVDVAAPEFGKQVQVPATAGAGATVEVTCVTTQPSAR
jgi:hypothetical protein